MKARKAVVLTCGGFENNQEMIRNYLPGLPYCYTAGTPFYWGQLRAGPFFGSRKETDAHRWLIGKPPVERPLMSVETRRDPHSYSLAHHA